MKQLLRVRQSEL